MSSVHVQRKREGGVMPKIEYIKKNFAAKTELLEREQRELLTSLSENMSEIRPHLEGLG